MAQPLPRSKPLDVDGVGGGERIGVGGALEPFMGMKVRRRSSMHKVFKGDYLDLAGNSAVLKLLSKQGETTVLFADSIMKVSDHLTMSRRLLIVTNQALYFLEPGTFKVKRRIALEQVDELRLSELSDNFLAIIVPDSYDYLLASVRKTELVTIFVEASKRQTGKALAVKFSNHFEYAVSSDLTREVSFLEVDGGVSTKIKTVR